MQVLNKKVLIVTIILAIITTYLSYYYLQSIKTKNEIMESKIILVASQDIPARQKITGEMLQEVTVPEDSYTTQSIQDKEQIIGKYSKDKILKGEVIPSQRILEDHKKELALRIPEGKRAVSFSMDQFMGVSDLIRTGDYVDIFVKLSGGSEKINGREIIYKPVTKLLLQRVPVLAIDKQMNRQEGDRLETPGQYAMTFALSIEESEKLIMAEEVGTLKLALRPLEEEKSYNTQGVIMDDLMPNKAKTY